MYIHNSLCIYIYIPIPLANTNSDFPYNSWIIYICIYIYICIRRIHYTSHRSGYTCVVAPLNTTSSSHCFLVRAQETVRLPYSELLYRNSSCRMLPGWYTVARTSLICLDFSSILYLSTSTVGMSATMSEKTLIELPFTAIAKSMQLCNQLCHTLTGTWCYAELALQPSLEAFGDFCDTPLR